MLSLILNSHSILCQTFETIGKPPFWFKGERIYKEDLFNHNGYAIVNVETKGFEFTKSEEVTVYLVYNYKTIGDITKLKSNTGNILVNSEFIQPNRIIDFETSKERCNIIFYAGSVISNSNLFQSSKLDNIKFNFSNLVSEKNKLAIAEILVFPKILNKKQREKLDTYFSIKYGVSLPPKKDYIDYNGAMLWNARASQFDNLITGIGKEKSMNLLQSTSRNADDTLLGLQIGIMNQEHSTFVDGNYLLWGRSDNKSNNQERSSSTELFNKYIWQANLIGESTNKLKFEVKIRNVEAKENCYLVFVSNQDKNSDEKYLRSYKMELSEDGYLTAPNVVFEGEAQPNMFYFTDINPCQVGIESFTDCKENSALVHLKLPLFSNVSHIEIVDGQGEIKLHLDNKNKIEAELKFGLYNILLYDKEELVCSQPAFIGKSMCDRFSFYDIYPNPVNKGSDLYIRVKNTENAIIKYDLTITNAKGNIIYRDKCASEVFKIKTNGLIAGQYQLTLSNSVSAETKAFIVVN